VSQDRDEKEVRDSRVGDEGSDNENDNSEQSENWPNIHTQYNSLDHMVTVKASQGHSTNEDSIERREKLTCRRGDPKTEQLFLVRFLPSPRTRYSMENDQSRPSNRMVSTAIHSKVFANNEKSPFEGFRFRRMIRWEE